MRPFPDLTDLRTFPFPESSWLEFKETIEAAKDKLIPTVCAFLNTEGGYLVAGVVDITLELKGIKVSKTYDSLVLLVDNIYHTKNIISEDGNTIPIGHVTIKLVETMTKAKIAVVTVLPGNGIKYKCKNPGRTSIYSSYYRLNASNYNIINHTENKKYTEEEVHILVNTIRDKYRDKIYSEKEFKNKLYSHTLQLQEKVKKQSQQFDALFGASKQIEKKLEDMMEQRKKHDEELMAMILEQKKKVEQTLEETKQPPFTQMLINWCFPCFLLSN